MSSRSLWSHSIALLLVSWLIGGLALGAVSEASAQVSPSQDAGPGSSTAVTTIAEATLLEINASLARIAAALEAQQEERGLEIMMKRIELSQRRLEPLEARLRERRSALEALENQRGYVERNLSEVSSRATTCIPWHSSSGPGAAASPYPSPGAR